MRVLAVLLAILVGGCSWTDSIRPQATVTFYGVNERAEEAWFGIVPLNDPADAVGFGADSGVACLVGPVGSDIAWFDRSPALGGRPGELVASVVDEEAPGSNVVWAAVAIDGSITTGRGVPAWWVGDAQAC